MKKYKVMKPKAPVLDGPVDPTRAYGRKNPKMKKAMISKNSDEWLFDEVKKNTAQKVNQAKSL